MVASNNSSPIVGLLCAAGSAVFNGSFTVPFKLQTTINNNGGGGGGGDSNGEESTAAAVATTATKFHPIVFTLYVSAGVFFSSWLFTTLLLFFWNPNNELSVTIISIPAILSGWIFVLGVAASFIAIDYIGMALAQGIWAGSATMVSYIWGTMIFKEKPAYPSTSLIGLVLLTGGVVGIVFSDDIRKNFIRRDNGYKKHDYRAVGNATSEGNDEEEEGEEEEGT